MSRILETKLGVTYMMTLLTILAKKYSNNPKERTRFVHVELVFNLSCVTSAKIWQGVFVIYTMSGFETMLKRANS